MGCSLLLHHAKGSCGAILEANVYNVDAVRQVSRRNGYLSSAVAALHELLAKEVVDGYGGNNLARVHRKVAGEWIREYLSSLSAVLTNAGSESNVVSITRVKLLHLDSSVGVICHNTSNIVYCSSSQR